MLVPSSLHNEYLPVAFPDLSPSARARSAHGKGKARRAPRDIVAQAVRNQRVAEMAAASQTASRAWAGRFGAPL